MIHVLETIFCIVGIILGILALLVLAAFAVAGVIYLFGEQDDWVEIDDNKNRK